MKKILVVDDDRPFRKLVAAALVKQGYEVVATSGGATGLAMAMAQSPDLVLSDVNMSEGGGMELLKELRSHPETSAIPIILMTGESAEGGARFSMDNGADDYLTKPFAMKDMVLAVSARLQRQDAILQAGAAKQHAQLLGVEDRLRVQAMALEAAANAIVITDKRGKILWVNPAFNSLTGYSVEESLGQSLSLLKSGKHPAAFYAGLWGTITAGKTWHGQLINRRKDGSFYHEEMTVTPVRDTNNEIENFIAIKQDISGRIQAEQALAGERDVLQVLMNSLPDHIYFKDQNSRFTRINKSLANLLGLKKPEDAIGKSDADYFPMREARQKLVDERRLLLTGEPILNMIEKSEAATATKWVSSTKVAVHGKNGEVIGLVGISRDITAAKTAEQELQRKSAFLEGQVNSSIDGILVVDEQGKKVLQNQRMIEIFKIPAAMVDDPDDKKLLQWVTKATKDADQFLAKIHQLYSQPNRVSRDEIELLDGTFLDRYSAPVVGKNGEYYGRMWTFRDITKRKRSEEELRWKTAFLEAQISTSIDGILVVDQGGTKILQNQRMVELFQIPRRLADDKAAETQRQWIADMTTNSERFLNKVHHLYAQPTEVSRDEVELKDGTILELYSSPVIGKANEYYGRIWTFHDITKRKRAAESLRDSEEKYRGLFENSLDAILTMDPASGKFISGNPSALNMFAVESEGDLISYSPADLSPDRQPDGMLSAERAQVIQQTVAREGSHCFEWTHRRVTGESFSAYVMLAQMHRNGKPMILATVRDITERKMLEAQLLQAQKLESIGHLAAGIAHEINTPTQYVGDNTRFVKDSFEAISKVLRCHEELLAAAKQNAISPELLARNEEVLAASDLDYLREQIPMALVETLEGVERVTKIVRAMKEFSHPGGSDKTPADLNKAIESTVTVARNEWKYLADLNLELDPELPFIPCFIGEFNQVILNLIVNAAHAIGDVVQPGKKGLITVKTRRDADWVEIRVTDTGTGIPEFVRPKIFAQFFTTKEVGKGTGQGLAMVYGSIVKRHNGTITFETEMGKGTTFIIRLPVKPKLESETASHP